MDLRYQNMKIKYPAKFHQDVDKIECVCPYSVTGNKLIGYHGNNLTNICPFYQNCSGIMKFKKTFPKSMPFLKSNMALLCHCENINVSNNRMIG